MEYQHPTQFGKKSYVKVDEKESNENEKGGMATV